jgi:TRAP-type C4-dicarboxylate transport system permease small subunit
MYRRALDRITDYAMLAAEGAITLMMLHVAAELAVRWFLRTGIAGTYEVVTFYYMVGCAYLPLAYVTRGDGHISAQIFTQALPARARELLEATILIGLGVFMAVVTWQTSVEAIRMTSIGEVYHAIVSVPKWPARWLLPIGGGFMAVYAFLLATRKFLGTEAASGAERLELAE